MSLIVFLAADKTCAIKIVNANTEIVECDKSEYIKTAAMMNKQNPEMEMLNVHRNKSNINDCEYALNYLGSDESNSIYLNIKPYLCNDIHSGADGYLRYYIEKTGKTPEEIIEFVLQKIIIAAFPTKEAMVKLSIVIPDYFGQIQRVKLMNITKSIVCVSKCDVSLVNESAAVISQILHSNGYRMAADNGASNYVLTIRFDFGPLEIGIYDISSDPYTPIASYSDERISGIHVVSATYEGISEKIYSEDTLNPNGQVDEKVERKRQLFRGRMWKQLLKYLSDMNPDTCLESIIYSNNEEESPCFDDINDAIKLLIPQICDVIESCLNMGGLNSKDISTIIFSGILGTYKFVIDSIMPLFPGKSYHSMEDLKILEGVEWMKSAVTVKQCLQGSMGLYSTDSSFYVFIPRFMTFPTSKQHQFFFSYNPSVGKKIRVFQNSIKNAGEISFVETVDLKLASVRGDEVQFEAILEVDDNGVLWLSCTDDADHSHEIIKRHIVGT